MKILLVDDADGRFLLERLVSRKGYKVSTAANGGEALLKIGESKPDLIVLDLFMPIINGWELLDTLASIEQLKDIPIIVYSGYTEVPQPLPSNVVRVLAKPVDIDNLDRVIMEVANEHRPEQSAGKA